MLVREEHFVGWKKMSVGKHFLSIENLFLSFGEKDFVGWKTNCRLEKRMSVGKTFSLVREEICPKRFFFVG